MAGEIYLILSWREGSGFEPLLERLAREIRARYPSAAPKVVFKPSRYSEDDIQFWNEVQRGAASFVYAAAASSSTTHFAVTFAAGLEKRGVPGVVAIFNAFKEVAERSRSATGVAVRIQSVRYPVDQLSDTEATTWVEGVIAALTRPLTASEQRKGLQPRSKSSQVLATGTFDQVNSVFHLAGVTDGLPIVPPTKEAVARLLQGTSQNPGRVVTRSMPPEGTSVTVGQVAVIACMAGCLPKHLPVLLAVVEALGSAKDAGPRIRSTNSFGFLQVINGPIRQEIGLYSGTDVLGSHAQANAALGRALGLALINLGRMRTGINRMAVIGNIASRGMVLPEAEEQSPWPPLTAVDTGRALNESTVTIFSGGWAHSGNYGHSSYGLAHVARDIASYESTSGAVIIVSPARARLLASEGMTKAIVETTLERLARRRLAELKADFLSAQRWRGAPQGSIDEQVAVYRPGTIRVVVAGGDASPMMQAWQMSNPATASIDAWR